LQKVIPEGAFSESPQNATLKKPKFANTHFFQIPFFNVYAGPLSTYFSGDLIVRLIIPIAYKGQSWAAIREIRRGQIMLLTITMLSGSRLLLEPEIDALENRNESML
jgi:hypothetical protein